MYQFPHIIAAVVQNALTGDGVAAVYGVALDFGDAGETCQHTAACGIAEAALDIVFLVKGFVDVGVLAPLLHQTLDLGGDAAIFFFGNLIQCHGWDTVLSMLFCNDNTIDLQNQGGNCKIFLHFCKKKQFNMQKRNKV